MVRGFAAPDNRPRSPDPSSSNAGVFMSPLLGFGPPLLFAQIDPILLTVIVLLALLAVVVIFIELVLGLRYIPNNRVGIIEKLWSGTGSVPEGRIIALNGEA